MPLQGPGVPPPQQPMTQLPAANPQAQTALAGLSGGRPVQPLPQPAPVPQQATLPGAQFNNPSGTVLQPAPAQPPPMQGLREVPGAGLNGQTAMGQLGLNQPPTTPTTSLEQNALNGGGGSNKQQISNFMNALNQSGAGTNNTFMNSQAANQSPVSNLINPNVVNQNNATTGNQPAPQAVQLVGGMTPGQTAMQGIGGVQPQASQYPAMAGNMGNMQLPNQFNSGMLQPGQIQQAQTVPGVAQGQQALNQLPAQAIQNPQMAPSVNPLIQNGINPNAVVSDKNLKTDIKPAESKIQSFMQAINAHSYQYKEPDKDGVGTFTSPMAQELEQTELGKQAVIETPRGKMVDYARLGGVNLAAVAVVHKEQERLQSQFDQMRKEFKLFKDR